jgi:hypothetical protein
MRWLPESPLGAPPVPAFPLPLKSRRVMSNNIYIYRKHTNNITYLERRWQRPDLSEKKNIIETMMLVSLNMNDILQVQQGKIVINAYLERRWQRLKLSERSMYITEAVVLVL